MTIKSLYNAMKCFLRKEQEMLKKPVCTNYKSKEEYLDAVETVQEKNEMLKQALSLINQIELCSEVALDIDSNIKQNLNDLSKYLDGKQIIKLNTIINIAISKANENKVKFIENSINSIKKCLKEVFKSDVKILNLYDGNEKRYLTYLEVLDLILTLKIRKVTRTFTLIYQLGKTVDELSFNSLFIVADKMFDYFSYLETDEFIEAASEYSYIQECHVQRTLLLNLNEEIARVMPLLYNSKSINFEQTINYLHKLYMRNAKSLQTSNTYFASDTVEYLNSKIAQYLEETGKDEKQILMESYIDLVCEKERLNYEEPNADDKIKLIKWQIEQIANKGIFSNEELSDLYCAGRDEFFSSLNNFELTLS